MVDFFGNEIHENDSVYFVTSSGSKNPISCGTIQSFDGDDINIKFLNSNKIAKKKSNGVFLALGEIKSDECILDGDDVFPCVGDYIPEVSDDDKIQICADLINTFDTDNKLKLLRLIDVTDIYEELLKEKKAEYAEKTRNFIGNFKSAISKVFNKTK